MATVKETFAAATATVIACTLTSLAATSARESATVDNTSNLYDDALVQVRAKIGATTPTNDKSVYIYAWGVIDPTSPKFPDVVTGSDAAITLNSPTQLRLIGVLNTPTASTSYVSEPMSVAAAFGGVLPQKWGIVIVNSSAVFTATSTDHTIEYQGVYYTIA